MICVVANLQYGQDSEEIVIKAGLLDSISILALPVSDFGCFGYTFRVSIPIKNQFKLSSISVKDSLCLGESAAYF